MMPSSNPVSTATEFPSTRLGVYANHAAMSPWPAATHDAVRAFAESNLMQGPMDYPDWLKLEKALREKAGRLLGAPDADDVSLLSNTTEGVGIVACGLDWQPGDNIVTARGEFPTNRLAWKGLADRGVNLREAEIRGVENPEAELFEQVDERTRLVTVSSVQWDDGLRLDLEHLGARCRDAGVLLFVDAIQQVGALAVDVQACQVDFLAAGSHKWQMGPEGMGLFYSRAALRQSLRIPFPGWRMLDEPYRFEREGRTPSAGGRRFEGGSPNTMGQVALEASLRVLERVGMARVEERVLANTARLMAAVDAIPGLHLVSDRRIERRSGIVSLQSAAGKTPELNRALKRRKVLAALRGDVLRLSPHYYQDDTQIDVLLEALEWGVKSTK